MVVPNASESHPLQRSLAHVTDATGAAHWQVDAPTPELRAAAPFAPPAQPVAPWLASNGPVEVAPAPAVPDTVLPKAVAVVETSAGKRTIRLDVSSERHAQRLTIAWHSAAAVEAVVVNGVALPPRPARYRSYLAPGWSRISVRGSSAKIEISLHGTDAADAIISDTSYGLPASAGALIKARDASGAVPAHDGDVTTVERRVTW